MKKTTLLFSLFISSTLFCQVRMPEPTQTPKTAANHGLENEINALEQQLQTDPEAKAAQLAIAKHLLYSQEEKSLPDTSCVVTIPIVFHVFHPNGAQGVPLSQINYAINDLNKTFAGIDADYSTVDPAFSAVKSYTKVRFKLAAIDPQGNPTNGVVYYQDKQAGYGLTSLDNEIASCTWDNYKYFNVYVMNDLYNDNATNNSGVCWYPSTLMSDNGTARMVYNYSYLGQGGSSFNDLEFNQTFTHECGHYLSLIHTFDGYDCAGSGDYCNDTPPTNIAGGGCNASICSALINGENYMDYNNSCYKNFTMDQNTRIEAALLDPSRYPLWQYDNLVATGLLDPLSTNSCVMSQPFLSYSKVHLKEDIANDGTIQQPPVVIYTCGGAQFSVNSTTLSSGTHYTLNNIPAGLSASIVTSSNGKSATLTFSGQATNHDILSSINNMTLSFLDAAFIGGNASSVTNYTKTFNIDFQDPWKKTCETLDISTTPASSWNDFQTTGPIPRHYGLWYNSSAYFLENYGRGITTISASSNRIQFQNPGTILGPSTTWKAGGTQGVLYSSSYPDLDNQTGYVGFRMQAGTDFYYGWMQIAVSSNNGVTLLEYQYNEKPNEPIVVGSPCQSGAGISDLTTNEITVYPNPATDQIVVLVNEKEFENAFVRIQSTDGKNIQNTTITGTKTSLSLAHLPAGVYTMILESKDQQTTKVIRFVKI